MFMIGIPEFESIGICRNFVRKRYWSDGCARARREKRNSKSYLTMDDGAKAAAEAVKAMIPARENFILIQGGNAFVPGKDRNNEVVGERSNWRMAGETTHAGKAGRVEIGTKSGPVEF